MICVATTFWVSMLACLNIEPVGRGDGLSLRLLILIAYSPSPSVARILLSSPLSIH
jgi:hypothetical protein